MLSDVCILFTSYCRDCRSIICNTARSNVKNLIGYFLLNFWLQCSVYASAAAFKGWQEVSSARLRFRLVLLQKLVATPLLALNVDTAIKSFFNYRKTKESEVGVHLGCGRMHAHKLLIAHYCHCRSKYC